MTLQKTLKEFDEQFDELQTFMPAYWDKADKDGIQRAIPAKFIDRKEEVKHFLTQAIREAQEAVLYDNYHRYEGNDSCPCGECKAIDQIKDNIKKYNE